MSTTSRFLHASSFLLLAACSSSETGKSDDELKTDGGGGSDAAPATDDSCPVVVKDADCDKTQRPFVFVHGTYGSGDNFAHVASLLTSNGFCADRIVTIEYNSLGDQPADNGQLDAAIDKVLADTGFDQVDLAGHSQGTGHCGKYLAVPSQAAKVAHYINFSGSPDVGDVETLSLSSQHDLQNTPHHATGNKVKTVTFTDQDHFAVAASTDSFVELYEYLKGEEPKYKEIQCGDPTVQIEGISESFADNTPVTGKLEVREVGGPREEGPIVLTITGDDKGHFGPISLKRNVYYEFKGFDDAGKLIGYQYFTPFKRSNRLVRFLTPPAQAALAAATTDHLVRSPNHMDLVFRWAGGGFRQDLGASMTLDGVETLKDDNAGAGAMRDGAGLAGGVVGLFMSDANENKESDLGLYFSAPFLSFTDFYVGTEKPHQVEVNFTPGSEDPTIKDQKIKFSNWPSDAAQVLVFFQ